MRSTTNLWSVLILILLPVLASATESADGTATNTQTSTSTRTITRTLYTVTATATSILPLVPSSQQQTTLVSYPDIQKPTASTEPLGDIAFAPPPSSTIKSSATTVASAPSLPSGSGTGGAVVPSAGPKTTITGTAASPIPFTGTAAPRMMGPRFLGGMGAVVGLGVVGLIL